MTMTLISTYTVGSGGVAAIEFGAGGTLPQTYTDLYLVYSLRSAKTGTNSDRDGVRLKINGATTNYTVRGLTGNGSTASSFTETGQTSLFVGNASGDGATASTPGNQTIYFPNYAGATNKSLSVDSVNETNATQAYQYIIAGLWSSTSAITSLALTTESGSNWMQYSTASLYGILKGSGGATVS